MAIMISITLTMHQPNIFIKSAARRSSVDYHACRSQYMLLVWEHTLKYLRYLIYI